MYIEYKFDDQNDNNILSIDIIRMHFIIMTKMSSESNYQEHWVLKIEQQKHVQQLHNTILKIFSICVYCTRQKKKRVIDLRKIQKFWK